MPRKIAARHGMSLVELLAVMVILAMLASLASVATKSFATAAKRSAAKTEIANIVKAIDSFYLETGRYPSNEEGIKILKMPTDNFPSGFLNKIPQDPWKHPYVYRVPGKGGPFDVVSLGSDGKEGGTKDAADIRSETEGT
jgi:general secretion pathway protein G